MPGYHVCHGVKQLFVLLFKIPVFMAQILYIYKLKHSFYLRGRRGRDRMVMVNN
jgi:hypothetical protein